MSNKLGRIKYYTGNIRSRTLKWYCLYMFYIIFNRYKKIVWLFISILIRPNELTTIKHTIICWYTGSNDKNTLSIFYWIELASKLIISVPERILCLVLYWFCQPGKPSSEATSFPLYSFISLYHWRRGIVRVAGMFLNAWPDIEARSKFLAKRFVSLPHVTQC